MAFFRKWKLHYKHKKLSEEWALATSMKDLSEVNDDENDCESGKLANHEHGTSTANESGITTFDLKYLGSTSIDAEKSEKSTSDAIKSVISLSKAARRKTQRVKLMVSPQGIDVINPNSGETLLRVSIYKISYCSADAAHDHVFAFVGSDDKELCDDNLSCHVFYCAKRKIAHDVTLTVAKSFENAYEVWRQTVNRKMMKHDQVLHKHKSTTKSIDNKKINKDKASSSATTESSAAIIPEITIESQNNNHELMDKNGEEAAAFRDLLIDFAPLDEIRTDLFAKDSREYLQNTWVSFDDDNNQRNDLGRLIVC